MLHPTIRIALHFFAYRYKSFSEAEAFIGYQRDTAAAVVFQATTSPVNDGGRNNKIDKCSVSMYGYEHHYYNLANFLLDLEEM